MAITKILIEGVEYDIKDESLSLALAQHISSGGTSHAIATESQAGFISPESQTKLNGIAAGANNYTLTNELLSDVLVSSVESEASDADTIPFVDSSDSNILKKISISNLSVALKSFFDTLYSKISNGVIVPDATTVSVSLTPGVITKIETLNTCTSMTVTLEAGNWWDEYKIIFTTGAVPPTVSFPSSITRWAGGTPTIEANKRYEVSILDGTGVVSSV